MTFATLAIAVLLSSSMVEGVRQQSPKQTYKEACGERLPVALIGHKVPGAGLGKVVPYETVLKDGYLQVACVKDQLFYKGDKFGDNKYDYTLGDSTNVSIVHYSEVIKKEDRKEMTHETCFEFCRTVPDMLYFGLIHGRDCYCAPYFKTVAGDSSECDEVCAAKPTQMCGGKTKSLLFEMHQCADVASNLEAATNQATEAHDALSSSVTSMTALAETMQTAAQSLQESFGQAGDPAAADLFQAAKVFAGELTHAAEDNGKIVDALSAAKEEASKLAGADFQAYDANKNAMAVTSDMEKNVAAADDAVKDLAALSKLASPVDEKLEGSPSKQYYSLMYFVDKKHEDDPSTCTGTVDQRPMVGVTVDECANACDARVVAGCVGFSYFPADKFCFLFTKFTEVTYWTGCEGSFLQKMQQPATTKKKDAGAVSTCYAKLSEFEGTSLAPNPSGKCAGCLTKATNAARAGPSCR